MPRDPREIYDLLLAASQTSAVVEEVIIGVTWTLCQAEAIGLCMSPAYPTDRKSVV